MRDLKIVGASIFASFLAAGTVQAESTVGGRYVGLNLGLYTLQPEATSESADLTSVEGRLGGYLNDNSALEMRAGAGFIGDELGSRNVDLTYTVGAYTRVGLPLENVFPYLIAGFTRAEVSFDNPDLDDSETTVSYGVGVDMNVFNITMNLEYISLVDKNAIDMTGFTVGFTTTF